MPKTSAADLAYEAAFRRIREAARKNIPDTAEKEAVLAGIMIVKRLLDDIHAIAEAHRNGKDLIG